MVDSVARSYDHVAYEYYDSIRHPTSANFRQASSELISSLVGNSSLVTRWACDMGAGKSVLAELFHEARHSLKRLILLDASSAMLGHSVGRLKEGAHSVLADAAYLPLADQSLQLVVASLADPFNSCAFWAEAARVLEPGGRVVFTTPSYEWAREFRSMMNQDLEKAEFDLVDNRRVYMPSFIYREEQQTKMIRSVGLTTSQIERFPLASLRGSRISWKITGSLSTVSAIVIGYLVTKPS